ncbi:virulence-associated E family protein [Bacteroides uniformis]|nr:virulence-associated E family protein [Bacteroides uniformis]
MPHCWNRFPRCRTHHPACEEGEQPKEDARRNGTPPPRLLCRHAAGRKALGEADILPSRDRREAHHQVPGRQPRQLPLRPGQQMLQQGPGRADSHQTGEKRVRTRVSRRGISPAQCLHLYRQDQRSRYKEGREKARHQPSDELSGRALRHPQEPHPDRLEFMPYALSADAGKGYRPMRGKDYNTIFVDLQMAGISCYQNFLRAVIDSNYAKEFNPYTDYLYALPPWDGTDYIARLADTLTTENRELWQEGFKRWIVGLVDCALSDEDMNQLVIILYSEQGKGKSSWIRRLLPPEWKEYFYNGIIDPSNKDDARLLATRIIINMEEFEGVKPGELAALKRIIAQDNVTQRKAYDIEAFTLPRHCSFIASTNNRQRLQDIGGNRRFLPITVTGIDYHTPVNHPGIYAQALALLKDGFRYWYEGEEIEQLNKHNERHRMKDPVEENLFVFFRKPLPEGTCR